MRSLDGVLWNQNQKPLVGTSNSRETRPMKQVRILQTRDWSRSANIVVDKAIPISRPPPCAAESTIGMKPKGMSMAMELTTSVSCAFLNCRSRGSVWFQVVRMNGTQAPMRPHRAPEEPTLRVFGMKMQLVTH